jgi:hypothetical protein
MSIPTQINPNNPPTYEDFEKARDHLEKKFLGKGGNVHTVYIGEVEKHGMPTEEVGLIVLVDDKIPRAQLSQDAILPEAMNLPGGNVVPVDVQISPQPKELKLMMSDPMFTSLAAQASTMAGNISEWRSCRACPLPGGVQIAPAGAGWVGTLSAACRFRNADGKMIYGAFTNYHVAVSSGERGHKMGHPGGNQGWWFGKLDRFAPIQFSTNAQNRVDAAVIDTWRDDGKFAPGTHTVKPEQLNLGKINPRPVLLADQKIGDRCHKSGRTTGYMKGRVVGIGGTSHISYDQGTARFVDQLIFKGDTGDMSQPGDSGSLILTESDNRPYALLFAGGGGTTIANPIEFVMKAFDMEFFDM